MNVVDTSGWLEYYSNDPNADFFAPAIENPRELIVPSISIYEAFKRVLQEKDEEKAVTLATQMMEGQVIDLNSALAIEAAHLSNELKLPMADSIILATARKFEATLWTQDEHFKAIQDVKYIEKRKTKE